jgi:hypothetical protein
MRKRKRLENEKPREKVRIRHLVKSLAEFPLYRKWRILTGRDVFQTLVATQMRTVLCHVGLFELPAFGFTFARVILGSCQERLFFSENNSEA